MHVSAIISVSLSYSASETKMWSASAGFAISSGLGARVVYDFSTLSPSLSASFFAIMLLPAAVLPAIVMIVLFFMIFFLSFLSFLVFTFSICLISLAVKYCLAVFPAY